MSIKSIYRSTEGKERMLSLYDRQMAGLGLDYQDKYIETRFGTTHIIVAGPEEGQPLLVFHGGNSMNPASLKDLQPLAETFRLYAPDTVGHPGKSAEVSLSASNDDYGKWASDIIDRLGFESMACMAASYGAGIVVKLAEYAPEKILKAVLVVPSGIANSSFINIIIKLGIPMARYMLRPCRRNLIKAVRPMAPEPDEETLEQVGEIFSNVRVKAAMPANATKEGLARLKAPVYVIAGEKDVLFPGTAVIKRAGEVVPNLYAAELLPGTPHMFSQNREAARAVLEKAAAFLVSGG